MDSLLDHLGTLNDLTPRIKVGPDNPISPEVVFGLDTRLWRRKAEEGVDWDAWGGVGRHEDEVEVRAVWRGGSKGKVHEHRHENRNGEECDCGESGGKDGEVRDGEGEAEVGVVPVEREVLESELAKLSFEIYRGTSAYLEYQRKLADRSQ